MGRGKDYTTTELAEIKGYLKDGCNYAEIGELMGRTRKSIEQLVLRQGWSRGRFRDTPTETTIPSNVQELKVTEINPMPKTMIEEHEPKMEKTLNDFKPRDIFKHLYKLGYRIKGSDWKVICIVEQVVNIKDVING